MIRHFFLDKSATIIKGSKANTGLNPILSINYGETVSRGLLHFNEKDIINWLNEEGIELDEKVHFNLKLTNCMSVDNLPYEKKLVSSPGSVSERASSVDLTLYKLTQPFDAGRGFDYERDVFCSSESYSEEGASWKYCSGNTPWEYDGSYKRGTEIENIHFDFGNENINVDITDYIKDIILSGETNCGLGLKFDECFETLNTTEHKVLNFFTDRTNTYFHPVIEAVSDDYIRDDRASFYAGKENRLYLYVNNENGPICLDELPTCTIGDVEFEVVCAKKGAYYVTVNSSDIEGKPNTIYYDNWSNIVLNGETLDDVELEFVVLPRTKYFQIGDRSVFKDMVVPSIYGIDYEEKIDRGEVREMIVDFRQKYTTDRKELIDNAEWRLYVKDANREIDIFSYQPVEKTFLNNFFIVNTEDLVPNEYFIDVRVNVGRETRYYKDVTHFKVNSNLTERYY